MPQTYESLESCSKIGIPICTLYNSELPFNFTCFTVSKLLSLLAAVSVQLEPMSSKAMSTLGTEELGTHASLNRGHSNSYFNQKKHLRDVN